MENDVDYQDYTTAILGGIFSIVGLYGAVWTLQQYQENKIRKFVGLIIVGITITDLINILSYIIEMFIVLITPWLLSTKEHESIVNTMEKVNWTVFTWASLSSSFLCCALAVNTAIVYKFKNSSQQLNTMKYVVILGMYILPFIVYFIPFTQIFITNIFDLSSKNLSSSCVLPNQELKPGFCFMLYHSLFFDILIVATINLIVCISIYTCLKKTPVIPMTRKLQPTPSNNSLDKILKLVMIYSVYMVIPWIPFLICYCLQYLFKIPSMKFMAEIIDSIFTPSRSYFHALGVYYAIQLQQHQHISIFNFNFFTIRNFKWKNLLNLNVEMARKDDVVTVPPLFDFSFDANDYIETSSVVQQFKMSESVGQSQSIPTHPGFPKW
ncbi:hypothetical protein BC833DRAFT_610449 [Globomyces pollinis-pini]|nr:hypothetical protein BC833DRAFT_610449 [Globomyces pollinis-pini]